MPNFNDLKSEYGRLLASMTIRPEKLSAANAVASRIVAARARYEAVSKATGVPWQIIGVIHAMEAGLSFKAHLHNGDSLKARTWQVPAGRPKSGSPPFTWEESAIDALQYDGLDKVGDWSPERECYELEKYNGWGYRKYHPGVLSPYLWSCSNHYTRGKYVADGHWNPSAVSGQCGAIAILKRVRALSGETSAPLPDYVPTAPVPKPASPVQKVGSAAAGAAAGAAAAASAGADWWQIGLVAVGCALIALAVVLVLKRRKA